MSAERITTRTRAIGAVMAAVTVLFALRVVGQLLVEWLDAAWLPAPEQWGSGLVPYPALLAAQVLILVAQVGIVRQVWRGAGRFAAPRPRIAVWLRRCSYVYAGSMVVRYTAAMALVPEWRWFGHTIPVVFHILLAAWLFAYARVLAGAGSSNVRTSSGRRNTSRCSDWYPA